MFRRFRNDNDVFAYAIPKGILTDAKVYIRDNTSLSRKGSTWDPIKKENKLKEVK